MAYALVLLGTPSRNVWLVMKTNGVDEARPEERDETHQATEMLLCAPLSTKPAPKSGMIRLTAERIDDEINLQRSPPRRAG